MPRSKVSIKGVETPWIRVSARQQAKKQIEHVEVNN